MQASLTTVERRIGIGLAVLLALGGLTIAAAARHGVMAVHGAMALALGLGREGERRADSGPLQHNAYTCILLPWPRLEDADRSPIGPIRPLLRMRPNGLECRNDLGNC